MANPRPSRRIALVLAVPALFLAGWFWFWWDRWPPDPVSHGHPLSWWVYECSDQHKPRAFPVEDLRAMGPAAVTWLAYAAEHGRLPSPPPDFTTDFGRKSQSVREWLQVRFHLRSRSYDERRTAIFMLARLGPDAAPAIPALDRVLRGPDEKRADHAAIVLALIGPPARPAILQALADAPLSVRLKVVKYLDVTFTRDPQLVSDAQFAQMVEDLIRACRDPAPEVRLEALIGIAECTKRSGFTPGMAPAIPVAIALLSDADKGRQQQTASCLINFGPPAAAAIPRLIELLDDPDLWVMGNAALALSHIDPSEKRAVPYMRALMKDQPPNSDERYVGRTVLQTLGEWPKDNP